MSDLDRYLEAGAARENTRLAYRSAIEHFEVEFKGLLPATAQSVAEYLARYGSSLAESTLRQRLAALASWHREQGFADPTRAPVVRQVLRGIKHEHPALPKQAKPLVLHDLERVVAALDAQIVEARANSLRGAELRALRDKSMVLLGFWRGFRSDEICRLRVQWTQVQPGQGMTCFLDRSKGDRANSGAQYPVPALSRLCPVEAYVEWTSSAQLVEGPVYRPIDRWGHVREEAITVGSFAPLLRGILARCGVEAPQLYSSHSLRRGFAGWAALNGWDLKALMEYVGWRDIKSAMRYMPTGVTFAKQLIEQGLQDNERPAIPSHQPGKQ